MNMSPVTKKDMRTDITKVMIRDVLTGLVKCIMEDYDYADREGEVSDPVLQGIRDWKRRNSGDDARTPRRKAARHDDSVDQEPYYRKPRRSVRERLADSGFDLA